MVRAHYCPPKMSDDDTVVNGHFCLTPVGENHSFAHYCPPNNQTNRTDDRLSILVNVQNGNARPLQRTSVSTGTDVTRGARQCQSVATRLSASEPRSDGADGSNRQPPRSCLRDAPERVAASSTVSTCRIPSLPVGSELAQTSNPTFYCQSVLP